MLRINLLPIRQLKKRAIARNQITSALIALVCVLLILGAGSLYQKSIIQQANDNIKELETKKKSYKKTLDKIAQLQDKTKELNRRITVINNLRKKSSLTVHILDEIASRIDNERVWLTSLSQQNNTLNLVGVALDNESVAQFMDSLKVSEYIDGVSLGQSTLKSVSGRNLKSFNLTCSVKYPETEPVEESGK
jgi:type IV pilus assembly protein PilN